MTINEKNKWLMPAEWQEHKSLWLAWPYDEITFPNRVKKVEQVYVQIISAVHITELVNLLVKDQETKEKVLELFQKENINSDRVIFHIIDYADTWIRDYGPIFVRNKETTQKAWVKWQYNAYGNKFPDLRKDNTVFLNLAPAINVPGIEANIVMEGGAFEVNGKGAVITTEQCLLNPNRNPSLSKEEIEDYLRIYTGAEKIIWISEGIVNDHTDGHIDDVAKFVSSNTIVCGYEDDLNEPNFPILRSAYDKLSGETDQDGNPFTIVKLPMPHFNYDDGTKAPASYANFYIGNGVVLVPTFNDINDSKALQIIQSLFPDRSVTGIDCTNLIYGGGAIHCITQQEPL
jgi:agmatine deiminase